MRIATFPVADAVKRQLVPPVAAAVVASAVAAVVAGHLAPIVRESLMVSLVYALPIHVLVTATQPAVSRIIKPGLTQDAALVGVAMGSSLAGCLVGGATLVLVGLAPRATYWSNYAFMARATMLLAAASMIAARAYGRVAVELRETKVRLRAQELSAAALASLEPVPSHQAAEPSAAPPDAARLTSRIGGRVAFVALADITHVYAEHKLTWAVARGKPYCLDEPLTGLEARLSAQGFVRIHRRALAQVRWIDEVRVGARGRLTVRLRDDRGTELPVSRARAALVRARLGVSPPSRSSSN